MTLLNFSGRACCPDPVLLGWRHVRMAFSPDDLLGMGVLLAILIVAVQSGLNLALGLVSLLIGVFLVAILHGWRNLAGIRIVPRAPEAVFAGESASFSVLLESSKPGRRWSVRVTARVAEGSAALPVPAVVHLEEGGRVAQEICAPAHQRGWLRLVDAGVESAHPLGLTRLRAPLPGEWRCLVYPQPDQTSLPLPMTGGCGESATANRSDGEDDLANLRDYQPGDPLQRIHWKTSARRDHLVVREFFGTDRRIAWLAWEELADMAEEARLSRLCRWVLDADMAGIPFGLGLPGDVIAPSSGEAHRVRCLTALALFGKKGGNHVA
ncbi:MAG: DUF58 domain-containing protein [Magnetococcales bacterium]|nr:DUF58 domain-containing protein [Magnetococcales bacterium]